MKRPAVVNGPPAFADGLPLFRPSLPSLERVVKRLSPSYDSGIVTKGPLLDELEERVADRLGVAHAVAVSSCTSGLMLAVQALLRGPVAVPSFTFPASAHAVTWNGFDTVFVEADARTFQVDLGDLEKRMDAGEIGGVLATHVFGAPCEAEQLQAFAAAREVPLVFDAAHGMGAMHQQRAVGSFGDAEVFSLAPTKIVTGGEGGIITTPHAEVAEAVRRGRNYGDSGDYAPKTPGLNARLSEFHAALGLESLDDLDEKLLSQRRVAERYRTALAAVPGIGVQRVEDGDAPTFTNLTVTVEPEQFGLDRSELARALRAEGIDTRHYFSPAVHQQPPYVGDGSMALPVTEQLSSQVLTLPMFSKLEAGEVDRVVEAVASAQEHAEEVRRAVSN